MLFLGGVASIFYKAYVYGSLVLYFLLSFVVYVYYLLFVWVVLVNMWQKKGEIDEIWKKNLIAFI